MKNIKLIIFVGLLCIFGGLRGAAEGLSPKYIEQLQKKVDGWRKDISQEIKELSSRLSARKVGFVEEKSTKLIEQDIKGSLEDLMKDESRLIKREKFRGLKDEFGGPDAFSIQFFPHQKKIEIRGSAVTSLEGIDDYFKNLYLDSYEVEIVDISCSNLKEINSDYMPFNPKLLILDGCDSLENVEGAFAGFVEETIVITGLQQPNGTWLERLSEDSKKYLDSLKETGHFHFVQDKESAKSL